MKRAPFNLQWKATLQAVDLEFRGAEAEEKGGVFCISGGQKRKKGGNFERWSDLDQTRSPSPPSSNSTVSSLGGGGAISTDTSIVAAVSDNPAPKWPMFDSDALAGGADGSKDECASELHHISAVLEMNDLYTGDWATMLSEYVCSPGHEQTFLRLVMNDGEDNSATGNTAPDLEPINPGFGIAPISGFDGFPPVLASPPSVSFASVVSSPDFSQFSINSNRNNAYAQPVQPPSAKNPIFSLEGNEITSPSLSLPPSMFIQQPTAEIQQIFGSNTLLNQPQQTHASSNLVYLPSLPSLSPSLEMHHNSSLIHLNHSQSPPHLDQTLNFPQLHHSSYQQQQQALIDMLIKAAELVEAGIFVSAHGILARLNHQLPSPLVKPLFRTVFYFMEALELLANSLDPQAAASSRSHPLQTPCISTLATPLDVVFKLDAYRAFSEVSPILQFTSFTATQALLEELNTAYIIHIIDFDIGVGGGWSSFMQELAQRQSPRIQLLKITAFVSLPAFHPLELQLIKENLTQFATDLNIPFQINIASIEVFDPAEILILSAGSNEAIAVNLPVGAIQRSSFPTLLRQVKQLLPKVVIFVDNICDRGDSPFSHHILHALQSYVILLDSIDAVGTNLDVSNKIEKFVLQPMIEKCVSGRFRAVEKVLPCRTQLALAGFEPMQFSNFTEMQADCLLKRIQVRGFHVDKHHNSLYLYWKRGELVSVSIWRCK